MTNDGGALHDPGKALRRWKRAEYVHPIHAQPGFHEQIGGIGIAMLPDYLVEENGGLVQLFGDTNELAYDCYFVYPEELKSVARVQVFRDFLVAQAQRWHF